MTISTLPAAPSRSDPPATFVAKADAFVAALATLVSETNALATQLNAMVGADTAGMAMNLPMAWSATVYDGSTDPGSTNVRFNNASPASTTVVAIDDVDRNSVDWSAVINTWAASTSTIKGQLRIASVATPTKYSIYNVTGVTDKAGYTEVAVTHLASGSSLTAENITVVFTRTGDVGSFGATISNADLAGIKVAAFNSEISNAGTTGAQTINWTLGALQKQAEPTGAITYTFTAPSVAPCHLQLRVISDGTSSAFTHLFPATVKWLGVTWLQVANKNALLNFFWDGTTYWAMGVNEA